MDANMAKNIDELKPEQGEPHAYAAQAEPEFNPATRLNRAALAHSGDDLEQALAMLPLVRAPGHTLARVLARIATIPQLEINAAALSIGLVPPRIIKYAPPVLEPLTAEAATTTHPANQRAGQFNPLGYLFIGLWLSLCIMGLYLVWPGIANLVFGPPQDADGLARLQVLQGWWSNLTTNASLFFNMVQLYLPTIVSAVAGVLIMLYIFTQQRRRLWLE